MRNIFFLITRMRGSGNRSKMPGVLVQVTRFRWPYLSSAFVRFDDGVRRHDIIGPRPPRRIVAHVIYKSNETNKRDKSKNERTRARLVSARFAPSRLVSSRLADHKMSGTTLPGSPRHRHLSITLRTEMIKRYTVDIRTSRSLDRLFHSWFSHVTIS